MAQTLDRRPRDLRDVGTFTRGVEVEAIARTLANGILVEAPATAGVNGVPPHHRQSMPKFDHLSETERQSLALYVKSFHDPTRQEAHQP